MNSTAHAFSRDGFAGPFRLTDTDQVRAFEKFVRTHPRPGRLNRVLSAVGLARDLRLHHRRGHTVHRLLYDLATAPEVLDEVETILGPDLLLWKACVIVREPGSHGQSWHVDLDNKMMEGVHVTFAVTAMGEGNGALQLIPGTHGYDDSINASVRQGLCDAHDTASMLDLADRLHPENGPHRLVTMTLEPGEYFLTKGGLWHGVPPNRTAEPRIAALARYMRPSIRSRLWNPNDEVITVASHASMPCMLVRGQDRHHLNRLCRPPAA